MALLYDDYLNNIKPMPRGRKRSGVRTSGGVSISPTFNDYERPVGALWSEGEQFERENTQTLLNDMLARTGFEYLEELPDGQTVSVPYKTVNEAGMILPDGSMLYPEQTPTTQDYVNAFNTYQARKQRFR